MEKAIVTANTGTKYKSAANKTKQKDKIIVYIILVGLAVMFILPFIWLVSTSLKHEAHAISYPPTIFPKVFDWANY